MNTNYTRTCHFFFLTWLGMISFNRSVCCRGIFEGVACLCQFGYPFWRRWIFQLGRHFFSCCRWLLWGGHRGCYWRLSTGSRSRTDLKVAVIDSFARTTFLVFVSSTRQVASTQSFRTSRHLLHVLLPWFQTHGGFDFLLMSRFAQADACHGYIE